MCVFVKPPTPKGLKLLFVLIFIYIPLYFIPLQRLGAFITAFGIRLSSTCLFAAATPAGSFLAASFTMFYFAGNVVFVSALALSIDTPETFALASFPVVVLTAETEKNSSADFLL
ncbi:MAG: hypothetical protein WKG06_01945 [Segetibacter sp.]